MSNYVSAFLAKDTVDDTPEFEEIRSSHLEEFKTFLKKEIKKYDDMDIFYKDYPCEVSDMLVDIALFDQRYKDNVLYLKIFRHFYAEDTLDDNKEFQRLRSLPEKINEYEEYLFRKYRNETLDIIACKENSVFCFKRLDQSWYDHLEKKIIENEEEVQERNLYEALEKEIINKKISEKAKIHQLFELNVEFFE